MPHKRRRSHDPELGEVPVSTVRRLDNVTRVISRGLESIGQAARATLYQPPSAVNRTRTAFSISRWMAQVTSSADPEPDFLPLVHASPSAFSRFMFSLNSPRRPGEPSPSRLGMIPVVSDDVDVDWFLDEQTSVPMDAETAISEPSLANSTAAVGSTIEDPPPQSIINDTVAEVNVELPTREYTDGSVVGSNSENPTASVARPGPPFTQNHDSIAPTWPLVNQARSSDITGNAPVPEDASTSSGRPVQTSSSSTAGPITEGSDSFTGPETENLSGTIQGHNLPANLMQPITVQGGSSIVANLEHPEPFQLNLTVTPTPNDPAGPISTEFDDRSLVSPALHNHDSSTAPTPRQSTINQEQTVAVTEINDRAISNLEQPGEVHIGGSTVLSISDDPPEPVISMTQECPSLPPIPQNNNLPVTSPRQFSANEAQPATSVASTNTLGSTPENPLLIDVDTSSNIGAAGADLAMNLEQSAPVRLSGSAINLAIDRPVSTVLAPVRENPKFVGGSHPVRSVESNPPDGNFHGSTSGQGEGLVMNEPHDDPARSPSLPDVQGCVPRETMDIDTIPPTNNSILSDEHSSFFQASANFTPVFHLSQSSSTARHLSLDAENFIVPESPSPTRYITGTTITPSLSKHTSGTQEISISVEVDAQSTASVDNCPQTNHCSRRVSSEEASVVPGVGMDIDITPPAEPITSSSVLDPLSLADPSPNSSTFGLEIPQSIYSVSHSTSCSASLSATCVDTFVSPALNFSFPFHNGPPSATSAVIKSTNHTLASDVQSAFIIELNPQASSSSEGQGRGAIADIPPLTGRSPLPQDPPSIQPRPLEMSRPVLPESCLYPYRTVPSAPLSSQSLMSSPQPSERAQAHPCMEIDHQDTVSNIYHRDSQSPGLSDPPPGPNLSSSPQDLSDLTRVVGKLDNTIIMLTELVENLARQPNSRRSNGFRSSMRAIPGEDGDDESDEIVQKRTSAIMRRRPKDVALSKHIRHHTQLLLKWRPKTHLVNTVSPDEANNFNPDQGRCCTEDGFRVYLEGTDAHKWNVSAAQVFAASFMKDPSRQALDPDVIGRKFRIYVRTLIRLYKSQQRTEQSLSLKKRENRRRSRKHNLFWIRHAVAVKYTELRPHLEMLELLGVEGMSSDESDYDADGLKQFKILVKPWRAAELTPWLRVFDAIHREQASNPVCKGGTPRLRVIHTDQSQVFIPVRRLPINCYSQTWYKRLTTIAQEDLSAKKELYNFAHTPNIMQISLQNGGRPNRNHEYA